MVDLVGDCVALPQCHMHRYYKQQYNLSLLNVLALNANISPSHHPTGIGHKGRLFKVVNVSLPECTSFHSVRMAGLKCCQWTDSTTNSNQLKHEMLLCDFK